jgi:hypothetical protein
MSEHFLLFTPRKRPAGDQGFPDERGHGLQLVPPRPLA